jgi:hypothetical protein
MWPDALRSWFDSHAPEAVRVVVGRLARYPVLRVFADRTASQGVARAREVAVYLGQYAGYFAHQYEFQRWLRTVSYREALRLVLQPEPVELILEGLGSDSRRVLRWRYIDQLTDDEVARMLDLRTSNRLLFDAAAGRKCSLDAYLQLCRALELRSPGTAAGGRRHLDTGSVFPLFPGVGVKDFPPSAKGGQG